MDDPGRASSAPATGAGLEEEGPGITGIGASPATAIGQRALLVRTPAGNVLWDMITYLDDELVAAVTALGGVSAIAISHPHFYGCMIDWAHAFGAPVYIHAADRSWVARPDPAVVFWTGEHAPDRRRPHASNAGVHFAGGQVLHWAGGEDGRGALLSGDILQVVQDRRWVSFMYSYPNLIPERPAHDPARARDARALPVRGRLRRLVGPGGTSRWRGRRQALSRPLPAVRAGRSLGQDPAQGRRGQGRRGPGRHGLGPRGP